MLCPPTCPPQETGERERHRKRGRERRKREKEKKRERGHVKARQTIILVLAHLFWLANAPSLLLVAPIVVN